MKVVSAAKRWTRLDVELFQYENPSTLITDYTSPSVNRILRIKTHYLFTQLENVFDLRDKSEPVPTYLERECPLVQHPKDLGDKDYSKIPDKFGFKGGMRWKECEFVKEEKGELRWGCWFELRQGEDLRNCAGELTALSLSLHLIAEPTDRASICHVCVCVTDLVPFFADCSKNGPEILAIGKPRAVPS